MRLQEALKLLRKELCYSQCELAGALHMSFSTINRWENGRACPNYSTGIAILRFARERSVSAECLQELERALQSQHSNELNVPDSDLYSVERESVCQLVDDSTTGVYVCDIETDELLYANRKAEEYFGQPFVKGAGQKCYQLAMGRDTPCPFCPKLQMREGDFSEDHIVRLTDGRRFQVRGKRIRWNGRQAHVQYLVDETNDPHTQSGVERMLESSPVGIGLGWVFADGRMEMSCLSDGYYAAIGATREERRRYRSFSALEAVVPNERETVRQSILDACRQRRPFRLSYHITQPDGLPRGQMMLGRFMEQSGDRSLYCCAVVDMGCPQQG